MSRPPLAITMGDPAGIGPEIIVKTWQSMRAERQPFLVIGDAGVLIRAGGEHIQIVSTPAEAVGVYPDAIPVIHAPLVKTETPGRPDFTAAAAVVSWIKIAVDFALSGEVSAVVTAPIAKAPLYEAGFGFPGHTEYLGALTDHAPYQGVRGPVMMLAAPGLRTVLVTVHEPLASVSAKLTRDKIIQVGQVTHQALITDFGIDAPRLMVTGLNPHAGEGGSLGREEIEIIAPAVQSLRDLGVNAIGPKPADSLFPPHMRATYDAVICMYHDQALIPLKMLDFWGGVNVSLGLPVVRTSPDHGVGFDIAGQGKARADSLIAACRMAAEIAARRAK